MNHKDFIRKAKKLGFMLNLKAMLPRSKQAIESMLKLIGNPNERDNRIRRLNKLIANGYIKEKQRMLYVSSKMCNQIEVMVNVLHNYIKKRRKNNANKKRYMV